jgi:hypothetical protein
VTEQRREGEGDLRPDCRVCVFSRQQSGPVSAFLSSGVPERAPGDRGWPGLTGWIKAQIPGKTRNRGRDWAEYRHPDVKNDRRGPSRGTDGDALIQLLTCGMGSFTCLKSEISSDLVSRCRRLVQRTPQILSLKELAPSLQTSLHAWAKLFLSVHILQLNVRFLFLFAQGKGPGRPQDFLY